MNKIVENPKNIICAEENLIQWQKVLSEFESVFGKDIYESWIKNIFLKKEFHNHVILSAPTRFVRDWVVSRYADKALDIIKKFKKSIERIEFEIDTKELDTKKTSIVTSNNITSIEQSSLNYYRLNPKCNFENFVIGESNKLAYTAAQKVCEQVAHYNPLYIYGGIGMGKTHLLNAIGLKMQNDLNVMFISAERFMYQFVKSLKNNDMVKFKDFFRKVNVFIIDDIQFASGKVAMQEEFFHTFNALIEKGSQVVISSDRPPINLERMQDKIKSRLSGGLVIDIQPTDFELRLKILKNKFQDIQTNFHDTKDLNDEVFNFLASEIKSNVREIVGALNRIVAFNRVSKKTLTVYECKLLLKDIVENNMKVLNIEKIQTVVSSFFKISMQEMLSPRRSRSLVRPRQIAMYLSKKYTSKSLPDIGRKFSNRDHTTVIHAVKTVEQLMQKDEEMRKNINNIRQNLLSIN